MSSGKVAVMNGGNIPSYHANSISVMKMAEGFASLGFDTEVVTADSINQRMMAKRIPDIYKHYGLSKQVPVRRLLPSLSAFLTGRTSQDSAYSFRAAKYVAEHKFNIAYCRSYLVPYFTAQAGVPTFVETHTTVYDQPALKKIYDIVDLPAFKGLITIHEAIKEEHVKRGVPSEKILVLEDGVDIERFAIEDDSILWKQKLGLDPGKRYVTYCGHLYPEKGIEMILAAAKKMDHRRDVVFLLVGGLKKWCKFWERYCREHHISNTLFTGFVPNSQVPKYLKASDCLLLLYNLDVGYKVMDIHTTSPLKLFEYMAAKRAIVASGIPTLKKVLSQNRNSLLAPPGDVDSTCNLIEKALDNPTLRQTLGENAYHDVQQYTWKERCTSILATMSMG